MRTSTSLAVIAGLLLAVPTAALAQVRDHSGHKSPLGHPGCTQCDIDARHERSQKPLEYGQGLLSAMQEMVMMLEGKPDTDWTKFNLDALYTHLGDMNELAQNTRIETAQLDDGLNFTLTGSPRTLAALARIIPDQSVTLGRINGWDTAFELGPEQVTLSVTSEIASEVLHIKGLGFIGLMSTGTGHHQPFHLALARGETTGGWPRAEYIDLAQDDGDAPEMQHDMATTPQRGMKHGMGMMPQGGMKHGMGSMPQGMKHGMVMMPERGMKRDMGAMPEGGMQHDMGMTPEAGMKRDKAMTSGDQGNMAQHQSYAGLQDRQIKALSDERIEGLKSGKGIGYALTAELNSYPGPRHVLDMAQELGLNGDQIDQIQPLFDTMQSTAITLGTRIIAAETSLDRAFADQSITQDGLATMVAAIAELEGELRILHLSTHLEMRAILSPDQIKLYDEARGYALRGADHQMNMGQN